MTDRDFLIWIHQRLVKVHGEREMVDYMHKLRDLIYEIPKNQNKIGNVVTMRSNEVLKEIREMENHS